MFKGFANFKNFACKAKYHNLMYFIDCYATLPCRPLISYEELEIYETVTFEFRIFLIFQQKSYINQVVFLSREGHFILSEINLSPKTALRISTTKYLNYIMLNLKTCA